MSAGYAERLSEYPNKGKCGLPEILDTPRALTLKIDALAELMRQSSHTVVLTGAGVSTSAGIPDFRGPNGIWTREMKERKKRGKKSKKRKSDDLADEIVDRSKGPTWVQCNLCQKWRKISASQASDLPEEWHCSLNSADPAHSKCSDPEEEYNHGSQRNTRFTPQAITQLEDSDVECIGVLPASAKGSDGLIPSKANTLACRVSKKSFDVDPSNSSKSAISSFEAATPTYTHRALTHLILQPPLPKQGDTNNDTPRTFINYIVTQNIDGLHRKSHLPRKYQSILHGDIFTEVCDTCHTEHVRPYEISSIGLSYTGRNCTLGGNPPGSCPGKLLDTLLDWENDLPEEDWRLAQDECEKADLIICMGTSLRIEPAGGLCMCAKEVGKRKKQKKKLGYVIVNLQVTPYDHDAALIIRGKVDDVMEGLMWRLGYRSDWDDKFDYGKSDKI